MTADGVVEESGVDLVVKVFAGEFFDGHPLALQVSRNPLGLVNRTETGYSLAVPEYRFTEYFEHEVLRKRPYLKKHGAFRFWKTRSEASRKSEIGIGFGVKSRSLKGKF